MENKGFVETTAENDRRLVKGLADGNTFCENNLHIYSNFASKCIDFRLEVSEEF